MPDSKPSVQRIKKEKRDMNIAPVPSGMSRRRFLTFLGTGSAALAAGSAGVLGCSSEETGAATTDSNGGQTSGTNGSAREVFFSPVEPTDADELRLPEGYKFDIIRSSGDSLGGDRVYGDHNDYVAYLPIDVLEGGDNSEDGVLWVNHEYVNPLFWSGYSDAGRETKKTRRQVAREKAGVGGSVVRVRKEGDTWGFVADDRLNRRIDATTPMGVTGPAAGSAEMRMEGRDEVIGTLANCGGGVTPWNTVLSCEENFQYYYGEKSPDEASEGIDLTQTERWLDDPENAQPPEHYGWVVEIDPLDPDSRPRKHTWLGRVRHENAAITLAPDGRVVVYTGHDQEDECIYKFVSSGAYDPDDREANMQLLSDGMLYVADFSRGRWVALDYENDPIFRESGFASQADVLVRTAEAVKLSGEEDGPPIGTPMDRCEDIEVHPETGQVYAALTNNENHGNFYGQIIRMTEAGDDPASEEFTFEVFAAGGPQTGFASPDNLAFDRNNNLWVVTDMSSSSMNEGIYETFKNNGAFFMPSGTAGPGGEIYQFASGPVQAELTGPSFTPDGKTLFLAVQHPGEETENASEPTSTWPGGDEPKSSLVAITGDFA